LNNEEKIIAMLEQLQQGQAVLERDLKEIRSDQQVLAINLSKLDRNQAVMQSDLNALKTGQNNLRETVDNVKLSQQRVELEQFPKIAAALDGWKGNVEKAGEHNERITYLEKKTDIHDTRLFSLEQAVKKA